ncbi:MAG: flippase-like domain-containing protein [bacterium]|nr:flippase-like domain-containing protein [bacterium]
MSGADGNRFRRIPTTLLKVVVTVILVAIIVSHISLAEAWNVVKGVSWPLFLLAVLTFAISVLAGAWQWGRFLNAQGIGLSTLKILKIYWIGLFFNNFMPGNVGGDVVKVVDLSRSKRDPLAAATATLADRLTGLCSLACLSLIAAWHLQGRESLTVLVRPIMFGSALFLLLAALFYFDPVARVIRRLGEIVGLLSEDGFRGRVLQQVRMLRTQRGLLFRMFCFSLLIQSLRVTVHFLVGRALLGDTFLFLPDFFLVIPPLAFALTLPITLGGLGLREGLAIKLFAPLGVSGEVAVAIELLAYLTMLSVSLIGGILFLRRREPEDISASISEK